MAYSSLDPVTGSPVFLSGDAPDPGVNETQVGEFSAQVGTRLIGTTTERTAYVYAREGLRWWDTTLDREFIHDGSDWRLEGPLAGVATPTYVGAVWAAHSDALQFCIVGGLVHAEGGFQNVGAGTFNAGLAGTKIGDVAAAYRPGRTVKLPASQLLPPSAGSNVLAHATLYVQADGQVYVSLSTTGTYGVGELQIFVAGSYRPV